MGGGMRKDDGAAGAAINRPAVPGEARSLTGGDKSPHFKKVASPLFSVAVIP
jgi:hypothetical protein